MNCARFDELHEASVVSPADADLPAALEARTGMDAHLAECPACRARLQNYVVTTQLLRGLRIDEERAPAPPLAESLVQRILRSVRAARAESDRGIASA